MPQLFISVDVEQFYIESSENTTSLSSTATNNLQKAIQNSYGRFSDHIFRHKLISFDTAITVFKCRGGEGIFKILDITASLYPVKD